MFVAFRLIRVNDLAGSDGKRGDHDQLASETEFRTRYDKKRFILLHVEISGDYVV